MADKKRKKAKKVNPFMRAFLKVKRFFRDLTVELKKVTWPTKKQVVQNTGSVLLFCLLVGSIIWIADLLLGSLVRLIYG